MQKVMRDVLVEKAVSLLSDGTVDRVLGWKRGEFSYDITPAVFESADKIRDDFVWN